MKKKNLDLDSYVFIVICFIGLTVLYSSEVLDVMYADFPEKYEELREYMRLKHAKELSNRQKGTV